jgi:predicted dehydrogenase
VSTRIGVVGAGVIARRHVRTLAAFPDVELAAVADLDRSRAAELAARAGARPFDDPRRMLDGTPLDAVYVCVPPFAHGELEREVVERDLPLFVEKPLAADLDTAVAIADLVAQRGLVTGVGYHWRWLDTVERAQQLLADRPARLLTGAWLDATPPLAWWQRRDLSGGQLVEQATHLVDTARVLAGEVDEVFAVAARTDRPDLPDCDVDDVTAATVRFASGAVGSFTASCLLGWPHRVGLQVIADGLVLELTQRELVVSTGDGEQRVHRAAGDPFAREDRAFVDAVQGRPDRTRATYAEALRTHRVTTTAVRSAALGRPLPTGSHDGGTP